MVFGAGGDRDRGKRPLMGAAAARLADSPSSPTTIRAARTRPRSAPRSWPPAPARARSATARRRSQPALNALGAGDVLVVAGKGHEQGQTIGATVLPFDDVAVDPRAWPGLRMTRRCGPPTSSPQATGGVMARAVRARPACRSTPARWARRPVRRAGRRDRRRPRASSPMRWRRARPARWCIACRRRADGAPLLRVDDTLAALHRARRVRPRALRPARVVAVTGSVGKTTTKEMLRAALAAHRHDPCGARPPTTTIGACR